MVGAVHTSGVIDEICIDMPSFACVLDSSELSQTEVAAFAHHPTAQFATVHADRVVRAVPCIRVGLRFRFHECADTAVPQQIDWRLQHCLDQIVRAHTLGIDAQQLLHLG